jgi:hypothetical protein
VLVVVGVVAVASGNSNGHHGATSTCAPGQASCGGGGSSTGTTGTN